jgi:hypothetical protein
MRYLPFCLLAGLLGFGCAAVKGNGQSEDKNFTLDAFSELEVSNAIQLDLGIGPAQMVKVTTDSNLIPHLSVESTGGVARIGFTPNFDYDSQLGVHATVSVLSLSRLALSGASIGDVNGISGSTFDLELSGASQAHPNGSAGSSHVEASGASILQGEHLTVDTATLDISGASIIQLTVAQSATGTASGASHLTIFGQPGTQDVSVTGGSTVEYP